MKYSWGFARQKKIEYLFWSSVENAFYISLGKIVSWGNPEEIAKEKMWVTKKTQLPPWHLCATVPLIESWLRLEEINLNDAFEKKQKPNLAAAANKRSLWAPPLPLPKVIAERFCVVCVSLARRCLENLRGRRQKPTPWLLVKPELCSSCFLCSIPESSICYWDATTNAINRFVFPLK